MHKLLNIVLLINLTKKTYANKVKVKSLCFFFKALQHFSQPENNLKFVYARCLLLLFHGIFCYKFV